MVLEKYFSDNKVVTTKLTQFVIFLSISLVAPLIHNQLITGSMVNAVLFISASLLGVSGAALICLVPSIFALLSGTLAATLAPMIPFIMFANLILVFSFNYLRKQNYFLGVATASVLKFLFLYLVASVLLSHLPAIALVFGWMQLVTALIGGALAYLFLRNNKNF